MKQPASKNSIDREARGAYGKVHARFWSSPTIRAMSEDGRTLALYLMTCLHKTIAGVFRLPDGYVAEDLAWCSARVAEAFAELSANGFATRCERTKFVLIEKHLVWNQPDNPNQRSAARKAAALVPNECEWKARFLVDLEPLLNGSEAVAKPIANQYSVSVGSKQKTGEETRARDDFAITFAEWREQVKAKGEMSIPQGDPIFEYGENIGLDGHMLPVLYRFFVKTHLEGTDARVNKRHADWRGVFRTSVRENWFGLWFIEREGQPAKWTSKGLQALADYNSEERKVAANA